MSVCECRIQYAAPVSLEKELKALYAQICLAKPLVCPRHVCMCVLCVCV